MAAAAMSLYDPSWAKDCTYFNGSKYLLFKGKTAVSKEKFTQLRLNLLKDARPVESRAEANAKLNSLRDEVFDKKAKRVTLSLIDLPVFHLAWDVRTDVFNNLISLDVDAHSAFSVHIDHVIPHVRGGETTVENLIPMHARTNQSKGELCLGEMPLVEDEVLGTWVLPDTKGWTKFQLETAWNQCHRELTRQKRTRRQIRRFGVLFWQCFTLDLPIRLQDSLRRNYRSAQSHLRLLRFQEAIQWIHIQNQCLMYDLTPDDRLHTIEPLSRMQLAHSAQYTPVYDREPEEDTAPAAADAAADAAAGAGGGGIFDRNETSSPPPLRIVKIRPDLILSTKVCITARLCQDCQVPLLVKETEFKNNKKRLVVIPVEKIPGIKRVQFKIDENWARPV